MRWSRSRPVARMIRALLIVAGVVVLTVVWSSLLHALVPRETPPRATRWPARGVSVTVTALARRMSARPRERAMTMAAPVSLFATLLAWLIGHVLGFVLLAGGIGGRGFAPSQVAGFLALDPSAGDQLAGLACWASALVLIGTFVVYLVSVMNAYARRELLSVRLSAVAARAPDAERILAGYVRSNSRDQLDVLFADWAGWLADIRSSHVSYPALVHLRPASTLCWLQAAVIMLDAAALVEAIAPSWETPNTRPLLDIGIRCFERLSTDLDVRQATPSVSLQGREQFGFDDTIRVTSAAGMIAERSPQEVWQAFQALRTRYAPHSTAIASLLLHNMVDARWEPAADQFGPDPR